MSSWFAQLKQEETIIHGPCSIFLPKSLRTLGTYFVLLPDFWEERWRIWKATSGPRFSYFYCCHKMSSLKSCPAEFRALTQFLVLSLQNLGISWKEASLAKRMGAPKTAGGFVCLFLFFLVFIHKCSLLSSRLLLWLDGWTGRSCSLIFTLEQPSVHA